jgi:hypothetical protein
LKSSSRESQSGHDQRFPRDYESRDARRRRHHRKRSDVSRSDIFGKGELDRAAQFVCSQFLHRMTMVKERAEKKKNLAEITGLGQL